MTVASWSGTLAARTFEPPVVRMPAVLNWSLTATGTPCRGAADLAVGDFGFGLAGGGEGVVAGDGDVAVELAVNAVDAFEVGFDGLDGGDFLVLDEAAKGGGGEEGDACVVHWPGCR